MTNVIVGGGISGLYAAYELSKNNDASNISIYEKTGRLGGRIYTVKNGLTYDIGAGRFAYNHKYIVKLINELKLSDKMLSIPSKNHYFINGKYIRSDIKLLKHFEIENYKSLSDIWKDIYKMAKKTPNDYMNKVSVETFIKKHFGENICQLLKFKVGYGSKFSNTKAITALNALKNDYGILGGKHFILMGGAEMMIDELRKILTHRGCKIYLNHEVHKIDPKKKNIIVMHSNESKEVSYENIIFSTDIHGLRKIQNVPLSKKLLKSVESSPLMRIYAVYPKKDGKLWFDDISKVNTDLDIQFIIPINKENGLIMISYTTDSKAEIWNNLTSEHELNTKLEETLQHIFPDKDIPKPTHLKSHFWRFGVHNWNLRADIPRVNGELLKHEKNNIFVAGEMFSNHHAWVEGGLQSVQSILPRIKFSNENQKIKTRITKKQTSNNKLPLISKKELEKHNTSKSLWSVLKHSREKIMYVYDLTEWQKTHPGGTMAILSIGGKDGTEKFMNNPVHNIEKIEDNILTKYRIGILKN